MVAVLSKVGLLETCQRSEADTYAVIGHFPEYLQLANSASLNHFSIRSYEAMDEGSTCWHANLDFLHQQVSLKRRFLLATSLYEARPKSTFFREIEFLINSGYQPVSLLWNGGVRQILVPPC